jgi:hypothetical protein
MKTLLYLIAFTGIGLLLARQPALAQVHTGCAVDYNFCVSEGTWGQGFSKPDVCQNGECTTFASPSDCYPSTYQVCFRADEVTCCYPRLIPTTGMPSLPCNQWYSLDVFCTGTGHRAAYVCTILTCLTSTNVGQQYVNDWMSGNAVPHGKNMVYCDCT